MGLFDFVVQLSESFFDSERLRSRNGGCHGNKAGRRRIERSDETKKPLFARIQIHHVWSEISLHRCFSPRRTYGGTNDEAGEISVRENDGTCWSYPHGYGSRRLQPAHA